MANELVCSTCGTVGAPRRQGTGSFLIELILWIAGLVAWAAWTFLFLLIPIAYTVYRLFGGTKAVCRAVRSHDTRAGEFAGWAEVARPAEETMMRVIPFALILASCATEPLTPSQAEPVPSPGFTSGTSRLVIVRDPGLNHGACPVTVTVDGRLAGSLRPGQKVELRLQPSEGVIVARQSLPCPGGAVSAEYRLKVGESASYRIGFGAGMGLFRY